MNIPEVFKLVPVEAHIEKGFDVIDGRHLPTVKVTLPACHPDDTNAWDRRDAIGMMVKTMLAASPTPPQPIYDERKERELFVEFSRRIIAHDAANFPIRWCDCVPDEAIEDHLNTWLAAAQSRAKSVEVGDE